MTLSCGLLVKAVQSLQINQVSAVQKIIPSTIIIYYTYVRIDLLNFDQM